MDKYNHWLGKAVGWLNGQKRYAITLGQTTYYSVSKYESEHSRSTPNDPMQWVRHEDKHKEQWKREGHIKFAVKYIYYSIRYGYKNNPYEVEARKA